MSISWRPGRFRGRLRCIIYALPGPLIVGLSLVFVAAGLNHRIPQGEAAAAAVEMDIVAEVNGRPLPRDQMEREFDWRMNELVPLYTSMDRGIRVEQLWGLRLEALERAIMRKLLLRQAEAQGISVSHQDLAHLAGQLLEGSSGKLRDDLTIDKLRQQVVAPVSVTAEEVQATYDRVTVRQIFVARRPSEKPRRTDEEALARAKELLARARAGLDFAELARRESEASTQETGGLMEDIGRGKMGRKWDEAVFALEPGQISEPIAIRRGHAIVKLEKRTRKLPEDFEEKKEVLFANLRTHKQRELWKTYQRELRESTQVTILDPELLAYQALRDGKRDEAIARLQEAAETAGARRGTAAASIYYQLATFLGRRNHWQEAAASYQSSLDAIGREADRIPEARAQIILSLARAYGKLGETEDALNWYQSASDIAKFPGIHERLRNAFRRLGRQDLVARETAWLDSHMAAHPETQRARQK